MDPYYIHSKDHRMSTALTHPRHMSAAIRLIRVSFEAHLRYVCLRYACTSTVRLSIDGLYPSACISIFCLFLLLVLF